MHTCELFPLGKAQITLWGEQLCMLPFMFVIERAALPSDFESNTSTICQDALPFWVIRMLIVYRVGVVGKTWSSISPSLLTLFLVKGVVDKVVGP